MSRVVMFSDGASRHNQDASQRVGGWAVLLTLVDEAGKLDERPSATKELSGQVRGATNNQMELEAVRQGLLALKREGLQVTIMTDSAYVIGVLSRHWKPQQNKALIAEVKGLLAKHQVSFEKVTGHSGHGMNERADALAVSASHA